MGVGTGRDRQRKRHGRVRRLVAVMCVGAVAGGVFGISALTTAAPAGAAPHPAALLPAPAVLAPALLAPALLAPDDPATGDPEPPDQTPVPDGLDEPAPVPDDSVAEFPPPARPGLVLNANTVPIAWIGTPDQRPADPALLTLQTALNTVPIGGTVSVDPNDYAFTGALTVGRSVTIDSASSSTLFSRFTVSGGGLQLAEDVEIGVASTGATVSVTASGAVLTGLTVRNPSAVARPTGIQLAAGLTGVTISGFKMDGGGEASSYGVNLTTGSATITDPEISGVASGVVVTAAATTSGVVVSGGHITAATSGISLGTASAPQVSTVDVTSAGGAGTGIDLASSSSAIIDQVAVHGFARGIGTGTGNAAPGPTITDATIDGVGREGIALGSTTGASVVRADITGTDANQSTGILVFKSTGTTIDAPTITGTMYGITTHIDNTGAGPTITAPRITAFGAITLGSTQGASVTDAVLDAGTWGVAGTGINLVNAGRVTVARETATGFLYAVGSQSSMPPGSDRADISITDITATGAPDASSGVYLLGAVNATISDVEGELTGAALVIHQSTGVRAQDIVVHGRQGPTPVTGAAILRAYGSQDVHVDRSSIDTGSYGFFYSATDGATVTNATVTNVVERALYGRSVANLEVSASTFTGNAAVGLFIVTTPENGISHDIAIHDTVQTDNLGGIDVLQGTTGVQILRNTVSGQPDVVTAGGAHDVAFTENTVTQATDGVAVSIVPLWEDGAEPGSYSSSGIAVQRNTFSGGGTWISVGSPDPGSPDAERRSVRDPVLVTGNTFPAASIAVQTFANAVAGEDAAADGLPRGAARSLPGDGPVAVDARDFDDPNDWGSACRTTGYLDGDQVYQGGGAAVYELTEAPVLYPMNCIDLSLTEALGSGGGTASAVGDVVTWTLTPHNEGPRAAPAGWTITQLLPDTVELVSMSGEGYSAGGTVATADDELAAGADGPVLTVAVRIVSVPAGATSMRNVAYISPAGSSDLDGDGFADVTFERSSPLVVPTLDTDTDASPTDNDAQGVWTVTAAVAPGPASGGGGASGLPRTGADVLSAALTAALLLAAGLLLGVTRRRPTGAPPTTPRR